MATPSVNVQMGNVTAIHRLISIAVKNNLPGKEEAFFIRPDMTPESLKALISDFVTWLQNTRLKMITVLPACIQEGYGRYCDIVMSKGNGWPLVSFNSKLYIFSTLRAFLYYNMTS